MMPTTPDKSISEEDLARQLNVPREKIRAQRAHAQPGEVSKKGNVIYWLRSAAEAMAKKLALSLPPEQKTTPAATPEQPKPAGETPALPAVEELTVCSSPMAPNGPHFANPFLIKARRKDGEEVVVRVLHSHKFLPKLRTGEPMTFKAEKASSGNWWLLVGREPRFPGMW